MRRSFAALALALAALPATAAAQIRAASPRPQDPRESTALRERFGLPRAQRLLLAGDSATRVRGVERIASLGTPDAIDALVDVMESNSTAQGDARMRLAAVRVLAGETKRANVRQLLLREVTDNAVTEGRAVSPLSWVLRGTAAMALARGGDRGAVGALSSALLRPGLPAEAAILALRAYPPESLDVFVESRHASAKEASAPALPRGEGRRLSPVIAAFLGEIGDLRAVDRLRALLSEGDQAGKAAAAVALAKLGDEAALKLGTEWAGKPDARLKAVGAEVLTALDAPSAPAVVTALIESEAGRGEGLRLALRAPSPALAAPLAKILPALGEGQRDPAIAAIGRSGGVAELVPLLGKPEAAIAAAFALATLPGDRARAALEQALSGAKVKGGGALRLIARAGTVRALSLDDRPAGLRAALRDLAGGKDPADRAAGTFGLVALGVVSLEDVVRGACKAGGAGGDCDLVTLAAAARGALALPDGPRSLDPLLPILARAPAGGGVLAEIAGAALIAHPDGAGLPTQLLAGWAEAGGALAPLAARALPSRDDEAIRGRIKRLLEGTDPVVRAHVALGLARDPDPSAVTLLTNAYRFEEDAGVRRAVVRALSRRAEVQREATLQLARDLDPDDDVRALARAAIEGRDLDPQVRPARGVEPRRSVAWITVRSTEPPAAGAPPHAARVVRSDGVAVPVVADPDGALIVPGLPPGLGALLLGR